MFETFFVPIFMEIFYACYNISIEDNKNLFVMLCLLCTFYVLSVFWLRISVEIYILQLSKQSYFFGGGWVIPQGTVDNNLGPDCLAGPKALDPNNCRQPTLWLHDLCLEVLTVHCIELRLFWAKAFPLLILLLSRIWHSSSRYNF